MIKFFKQNRCAMPLIFLLIYGLPLSYLLINFNNTLLFYSRIIGLIAFINVFAQVLLGSFRSFFKKLYNPLKVFKLHNYLGMITLILGLTHWLIYGLTISLNPGLIALSLMTITVITSDLKYFFNVNINNAFWRLTHLLNYSLFPILYIHALNLGLIMQNSITFTLITSYLIFGLIAGVYKLIIKVRTKQISS